MVHIWFKKLHWQTTKMSVKRSYCCGAVKYIIMYSFNKCGYTSVEMVPTEIPKNSVFLEVAVIDSIVVLTDVLGHIYLCSVMQDCYTEILKLCE